MALGGEDTLGVASKLFKDGIPTVGIPKTMDNDLSETDYTFGFDTSVSVNVEAVDRLRDTARSHSRVIVLEVMGRHAGWVALHTGIAGGADYILCRKCRLTWTPCAPILKKRMRASGMASWSLPRAWNCRMWRTTRRNWTAFGHVILGDRNVGETIAKEIEKRTGY